MTITNIGKVSLDYRIVEEEGVEDIINYNVLLPGRPSVQPAVVSQ